jgi:YD repeat-containing protein
MATITDPGASRAVAVRTSQALRMVASAATNWWAATNGGAYSQINGGGTVSVLVWTTPSTITRRFTFDDVQIIAQATQPAQGTTGSLLLNVCEGPPAVLQVAAQVHNDALGDPPLRPNESGQDDPPLAFPLLMPGANRDGLGTILLETVSEPSGPANLAALYGPGLLLDTSGRLGSRTALGGKVRGLGPFPASASYHHGAFYFNYDFGKQRTIGLTRVLFSDSAGNVAIVRGDGRRNTYRNNGSNVFTAAASLQNTLSLSGGVYTETAPSGTQYLYNSTSGHLTNVIDRYGNPVYYSYDANSRLQQVQGLSGASGLVPYLAYDATTGLLSTFVLQDWTTPANNRTSYFSYDANRNLTRIIGPENCITYFAYSPTIEYLGSVTDPSNFTWTPGYDANNRVNQIVDALGNTAYFAYDTGTPITTLKDRAGKATYFQYNAFGSPITAYSPGTAADYYTYDGEANLLTAKNRLGNQWSYQYDGAANRISSTDPLGARTYFAYDAQDLLRTYIDPLLRVTYLGYDANRNRTTRQDPFGNTTYYQYQATGLLQSKKDRLGAINYFIYDAKANPTGAVDPLGYPTYYGYDSAGDRTAAVDPIARISYFAYDKRSRLTQATDPIGAVRYYAYDPRCNLVTEVDPNNNSTYYTYDGNSNRTQMRDALGNPTYYRYDPEERLQGQKNARLFETTFAYDALGRRQKQTDPLGGVIYFGYDAAHERTVSLDPLLNPTYFSYDLAGRLQNQTDAYQNQTYFGYDAKGNRVLTTDQRGNPTYFSYDLLDRLSQSKNAILAVTYMGYDAEADRVLSLDPLLNPSYFSYDLARRLTQNKDALFNTTYLGYDGARQQILGLDQLFAPTYFSYDGDGRKQNTKDAFQNQTYMGYDLAGNQVLGLDELGTPTYYAYDAVNRRTSETDVFLNQAVTTYDAVSNVLSSVDKRGNTTYYSYDALNRRSSEKDSVYLLATYHGYDAASNQVIAIDQLGFASYFTYDLLNRASSIFDQGEAFTYFAYDAASNRLETRVEQGWGNQPWGSSPYDGERRSTYFQYDAVNRVTMKIDALAGQWVSSYDAANNKTQDVDPIGRTTYYVYDALNRELARYDVLLDVSYLSYDARGSVVKRIDAVGRAAYFDYDLKARTQHQSNALGQVSYFGYDARSSRILLTNPRNFSTYFSYDNLRRLSTQKDALNGVRYFGYDQVGNQVLQLDELFDPSYYVYDGLNRLSQALDATLAKTYFGYDAVSNTVLRIDADGRKTYYGYDGAWRLSKQMFDTDPWIYYAYDSVMNQTIVDDTTGKNVYARDKLDRLVSKTTLAGTVYYAYDASGKKAQLYPPDGSFTYYYYDLAGRLSSLTLSGLRSAYYAYDQAGLPTKKALPLNVDISYYRYDVAARLSQLENRFSDLTLVSYFAYNRDANGNPTSITREAGINNYYTYDARDRLTLDKTTSGASTVYGFTYSYDAASNRLTKTDTVANQATYYVYNKLNLLSKDFVLQTTTTTYYAYDSSQRMTKLYSPSSAYYFTFDQRDEATQIANASTGTADAKRLFTYTGTGERVIVDESGGTAPNYWAYDGRKLLSEVDQTGALVRRYRHNDQAILDTMGSVVEVEKSGTRSYPSFDQRGSTKQLRSSGLDVTDSFEYDAFGNRLAAKDTQSDRLQFVLPQGLARATTTLEMYAASKGGVFVPRPGRLLVPGTGSFLINPCPPPMRLVSDSGADDEPDQPGFTQTRRKPRRWHCEGAGGPGGPGGILLQTTPPGPGGILMALALPLGCRVCAKHKRLRQDFPVIDLDEEVHPEEPYSELADVALNDSWRAKTDQLGWSILTPDVLDTVGYYTLAVLESTGVIGYGGFFLYYLDIDFTGPCRFTAFEHYYEVQTGLGVEDTENSHVFADWELAQDSRIVDLPGGACDKRFIYADAPGSLPIAGIESFRQTVDTLINVWDERWGILVDSLTATIDLRSDFVRPVGTGSGR